MRRTLRLIPVVSRYNKSASTLSEPKYMRKGNIPIASSELQPEVKRTQLWTRAWKFMSAHKHFTSVGAHALLGKLSVKHGCLELVSLLLRWRAESKRRRAAQVGIPERSWARRAGADAMRVMKRVLICMLMALDWIRLGFDWVVMDSDDDLKSHHGGD